MKFTIADIKAVLAIAGMLASWFGLSKYKDAAKKKADELVQRVLDRARDAAHDTATALLRGAIDGAETVTHWSKGLAQKLASIGIDIGDLPEQLMEQAMAEARGFFKELHLYEPDPLSEAKAKTAIAVANFERSFIEQVKRLNEAEAKLRAASDATKARKAAAAAKGR